MATPFKALVEVIVKTDPVSTAEVSKVLLVPCPKVIAGTTKLPVGVQLVGDVGAPGGGVVLPLTQKVSVSWTLAVT